MSVLLDLGLTRRRLNEGTVIAGILLLSDAAREAISVSCLTSPHVPGTLLNMSWGSSVLSCHRPGDGGILMRAVGDMPGAFVSRDRSGAGTM